jgi:hypothetical protein
MTTWNYGVFQETDGQLVFREVFYDRAGQRIACSRDPIELRGETLDDLKQLLQSLQSARQEPVLTLDDIPSTDAIPVSTHHFSHTEVLVLLEKNPLLAG